MSSPGDLRRHPSAEGTPARPGRAVRIGGVSYPVVLPTMRDPRLHLAAVILTIHAIGVTTLGFRVSVPQILAAILTCALVEVAITFRRIRQFVWPASAMLTGSGVALILRVVGTDRSDPWSFRGWHLFAAIAGLSLVTKYLVRYRGSHVFNPSNVGLVVAFLVLGSSRIEPLDFWWAPLDLWMAGAYLVILVGGLLITRRLNLVAMAVAFWGTLAVGLGALAGSGHCMTTAWSLQPVCGSHFWWVVVTSPEVLIFLFFMITDPKTIPSSPAARVAFGVVVAFASTFLIAPATTEFGAKVGLLAGLAVLSSLRPVFDRSGIGAVGAVSDLSRRLAFGSRPSPVPRTVFVRGVVIGVTTVALLSGVVWAGAPARGPTTDLTSTGIPQIDVEVDPTSLPAVEVSVDAEALGDITADPATLAQALAEGLAVEAEAIRRSDPSVLRTVDAGGRLAALEDLIADQIAAGVVVVPAYRFDTLRLDVAHISGPQGGASLAFEARGVRSDVTYDARGIEQERSESPFELTFVLGPSADGGWLIMDATS